MAAFGLITPRDGDCAQPLRVLSVIPGDGQGASFIFARRQAGSLVKLGVNLGLHYCESPRSLGELWSAWKKLRTTIKKFDPQVVHANYGTITASLCAIAWPGPLVITYRGSDLNPDFELGVVRVGVSHLLSQLSSLKAERVICTSAKLKTRLWWSKRKAQVLTSGIDLETFLPLPQQQARTDLHWGLEERVALFNAGQSPALKGLSVVKQAVLVAEKNVGPIRLHILNGTTPPEDVPLLMNAADCLVVASKSEGSPNIVKEALACNLPVIAVDVGDIVERLQNVSPSRIVPLDTEKMGLAIADILLLGIRSNGRQSVYSISEDRIARTLLSVYHSCVEDR